MLWKENFNHDGKSKIHQIKISIFSYINIQTYCPEKLNINKVDKQIMDNKTSLKHIWHLKS